MPVQSADKLPNIYIYKNYFIIKMWILYDKVKDIFKVSETFSDHSLLLPEKLCFVDFPAVPSLLSRER